VIVTPGAHLLTSAVVLPAGGPGQPGGFSPSQIRQAYGFNQITFNNGTVKGDGSGQTIAIIDGYDQPNIASDLATFDATYGLPAPPSFTKVDQNGGTNYPPPDPGWGVEISLDVEWAHAMAPGANILLVEATDLFAGVNYARSLPGVTVVSMSWGASEWSSESAYYSGFTTPAGHSGITFVAASGDNGSSGAPEYPSVSPNVLAVGGTELTTDSLGDYLSETGWSGSGGGISAYETQPAYQQGVVTQSSSMRTVPDVAYNAAWPYAVYDTSSEPGWIEVYGTSAGAPQWAALVAIADQGRALAGQSSLDGPSQTLPMLYQLPGSDFHDITSGSNGAYSAGPGYDLVTGLGTPVASLIVPALAGVPSQAGPSVVTPAQATPSPVTGTTTSLSVLGTDPGGASTLTYTWSVTSAPAGAAAPTFSLNGTNQAQNTTATFYQAGTYTFLVTLADPGGLTATSTVTVTVVQTLTTLSITPGNVTLANGATQQFTAAARDQFGKAMASQPAFTWQVSGGGTISGTGLYTAPTSGTGNFQVNVSANGQNAQANVTVTTIPAAPSNLTAKAKKGSAQVQLQWTGNSTNQSGFVVQRSSNGGVTWTTIVVLTGNPNTYTDTTARQKTTYTYRVYAYNAQGNSPFSNLATVTTG